MIGNTYHHKTFTECVSNQYTHFYISTCQMLPQVMEHNLILCVFLVFSYTIDDQSYLNCCISTKLSQIVLLVIKHIYDKICPLFRYIIYKSLTEINNFTILCMVCQKIKCKCCSKTFEQKSITNYIKMNNA